MPQISVIVPVYNAENLIQKCAESLKAQSFRDFEIVFVNDGSNDHSLSMLQNVSSDMIDVKIITQNNRGQAVARNQGIEISRGEFICFVDIDDFVEPMMLEKLWKKQNETNADIVWCDAYIIKEDKQIGRLDQDMMKTDRIFVNYILNNAGPCRKLIRKSIITKNDLFFPKIRFYEDVAVIPAYALYADKIVYLEEPLYDYVMNEGSTMHQAGYNKSLEDIFASMEYLRSYFNGHGENEYQECLEFIHIDHLLHAASLRFFKYKEGIKQLDLICKTMQHEYPNWEKNHFYKQKDWKYKLVCKLFYKRQYWLLHKLLDR